LRLHPELLQKSVLGIIRAFCGKPENFFQRRKNLATLIVNINPLFLKSNKNYIGKQHKN
jgi:hypothetical protein